MQKIVLFIYLFFVLNCVAFAHDYSKDNVNVDHPIIKIVKPNSKVGAGYMKIINESNKEIFDKIHKGNQQKRIINFLNENSLDQETFNERISLLLDPQTCGPLLISCNRKYEDVLKDKWYKVGEVVKM